MYTLILLSTIIKTLFKMISDTFCEKACDDEDDVSVSFSECFWENVVIVCQHIDLLCFVLKQS